MSNSGSMRIICERSPLWNSVKFWVKEVSRDLDGTRVAYAMPLTMVDRKQEDDGMEMPPTFQLGDETAQNFMDELWRCGFRPTEGAGSAGSLAATERHLADLRRLVFDKPGAETRVATQHPTQSEWDRLIKERTPTS